MVSEPQFSWVIFFFPGCWPTCSWNFFGQPFSCDSLGFSADWLVFHGGLAFSTFSVLVAIGVRRFDCRCFYFARSLVRPVIRLSAFGGCQRFCFARSLARSGLWRGAKSSGSVVLGCSVPFFRWFGVALWSGRVCLAVLLL
jgi:hypothetical protein